VVAEPKDANRWFPMAEILLAAVIATGTHATGSTTAVELGRLSSTPERAIPMARDEDVQGDVRPLLREIRRRSALTWDQLASIFAVSRRAVHHWASGKAASVEHTEKVRALFAKIDALRGLRPFEVRGQMLAAYDIEAADTTLTGRSEPILIADQTPLSQGLTTRATPRTRIKRG
jgi:DNA-binding XRE family transcriptional regulator